MKSKELEAQRDDHLRMKMDAEGKAARESREVEACERLLGALKNYEEVFNLRGIEVLLDRGSIGPAGRDKKVIQNGG